MSKRNDRKVMASASITETHFLFAFIRPVDPSGLPFEDIHVSIAIATGKPYQQSFFCASPSFPPAPIASTPKPISFEELHKLNEIYPMHYLREVWRKRLVSQGAYYDIVNWLLAAMFFDIKNPDRYLKRYGKPRMEARA